MLATKLGHFCGEVCAISFFAPPSFPCRQPFSMSCFGTHCCAVGAEGHCSSEMKALAFRSLPDASTLERLADPRHHHLPPFFFVPCSYFPFLAVHQMPQTTLPCSLSVFFLRIPLFEISLRTSERVSAVSCGRETGQYHLCCPFK